MKHKKKAYPTRIVYLAAPYSHPAEKIMVERFQKINKAAGILMKSGFIVFSPISQGHVITRVAGLPGNWEFHQESNKEFIKVSAALIVLMLPGWMSSIGVKAELSFAKILDIPVFYRSEHDLQRKSLDKMMNFRKKSPGYLPENIGNIPIEMKFSQ